MKLAQEFPASYVKAFVFAELLTAAPSLNLNPLGTWRV